MPLSVRPSMAAWQPHVLVHLAKAKSARHRRPVTTSRTAEPTLSRYPLVVFFLLDVRADRAVRVPRAVGVPVGMAGQLWTWVPAVAAVLAASPDRGATAGDPRSSALGS